MECYNHPGKISPALCRVCAKGLCRDCLQDYEGKGFVCGDSCAEHAYRSDQVLEWSAKYVLKKGKSSGMSRQYGYFSLIFAVVGLVFIGQEIYNYLYGNHKIFYFSVIFGICMLLFAGVFKKIPE